MNTFIDLIDVTPATDNIVASVMAHREERNGWTRFQFREMPGLEIKCGMVLTCDTGRYTIISIKKIDEVYLQAVAKKVEPVYRGQTLHPLLGGSSALK